MGQRGPRPTPTEVLRLRGSPRADLNRNEPKPAKEPPPKPDWLGDEAAEVWDDMVPRLMATRVLTTIDGNALARYAEHFVQWKKATAFVRKHGVSYAIKDGNGRTKALGQFPEVALMHKASATLARLEAEFGLTPSSRTRINVAPEPLPDPKGYFAAG